MSTRLALALSIIAGLAAPAEAQLIKLKPREIGPPPGTPPLEAEIWPFPPPDPKSWWEDKRLPVPEAADPLGGRRIRRTEQLVRPDNGVEPSTYRLWGLMPLQWQMLRGREMILEVWTRPTGSVRQTVTRITVRGDGETFMQGRAGLACCEATIGRRIGFDAKLPPGSAERFQALRDLPIWAAPRDVRVAETGAADALCVQGTGYDITLALPGRAVTLHRACDPAEVGEAADVLEAVLSSALGHDPRFDMIFPRGAGFESARAAYRDLLAEGGRLRPNPDARGAAAGSEPLPQPEAEPEPEPAASSPPAPS